MVQADLEYLAQREGGRGPVPSSRPSTLEQVEDVVDEQQQVTPGRNDVGDVVGLAFVQRPEELLAQEPRRSR